MTSAADTIAAEAVGAMFLKALRRQDWAALQSCFALNVQFRALTPPGLRGAGDADAAVGYLSRWFGDADQLVLVDSRIETVQDRLSISYRFRAHEDQWYVVEQRAYCNVSEGRIEGMDLLCSGFRPETGDNTQ